MRLLVWALGLYLAVCMFSYANRPLPPTGISRPSQSLLDCIAHVESRGNPKAVSRTGRYHGAFQFQRSTWNSVSNARQERLWPVSKASMAEQRRGAKRLLELRGLAPWPTAARRCR